METRTFGCPNCGAPLDVPLGEVEALCEYCRSKLRFIPEENELEVVRTREEMKHRERIAVEKQILRNKLEHEEMDRWRETASKVAFTVYETGRLLPADQALEFSIEYGGVVVFGAASVVEDPEEAEYGLQLLLDKYAPHLTPGRDYRPITADEMKRTTVFRLDIESWSGKRKFVEHDFPGAYRYEDRGRLAAEAAE